MAGSMEAAAPERNVEVVRALYAAMNARDLTAAAELLDPDVEVLLDRAEMFEEIRVEPESLREKAGTPQSGGSHRTCAPPHPVVLANLGCPSAGARFDLLVRALRGRCA